MFSCFLLMRLNALMFMQIARLRIQYKMYSMEVMNAEKSLIYTQHLFIWSNYQAAGMQL